jgi:magnesium chelatase family protein
MVLSARRDGRAFVLPAASAAEASLVRDAIVHPAASLLEVCAHLTGRTPLPVLKPQPPGDSIAGPDLIDVRGQARAKRALEVAAAGSHSILMIGRRGPANRCWRSVAGLLPPLSEDGRSNPLRCNR